MKVSVAFLACVLSLAPFVLAAPNPPPRYVKDLRTGIMKLNEAWTQYQAMQNGKTGAPAPSKVLDLSNALPIVSNMEQYMEFNNVAAAYNDQPRPFSESQESTINMMQDPEMARQINIASDQWVDALGAVFAKYETPIGLMNKLFQLQNFDALEFVVDDSGSMTLDSDVRGPHGNLLTRWQEVEHRLKELMEILAYVPTKSIRVCFLNRCETLAFDRNQNPLSPDQFIMQTTQRINEIFRKGPTGGTPFVEKIQLSLLQEGKIARYFFGDGQPSDMPIERAKQTIKELIEKRNDPANNPVTFFSCSDKDTDVEWMKEVEEVAPYCSELDDYEDEAREVLKDQGRAFPFTKGFYLIASLVGALNPDDLDAMDESIPFTRISLDNMLGMKLNPPEYQHYYQQFTKAQSEAYNLAQSSGKMTPVDQFKLTYNWQPYFQEFTVAVRRDDIEAVRRYHAELFRISGGRIKHMAPQTYMGMNQQSSGPYASTPGQQGPYPSAPPTYGPLPGQQPGQVQSLNGQQPGQPNPYSAAQSPYGQQSGQQSPYASSQQSPYGQQSGQPNPYSAAQSPYGQQPGQPNPYSSSQQSPYGQQSGQPNPYGSSQQSPYGQQSGQPRPY